MAQYIVPYFAELLVLGDESRKESEILSMATSKKSAEKQKIMQSEG